MSIKHSLPGVLLSVTGLAIFFVETGVEFAGPQLPDTAFGYVGWILFVLGIGLVRIGMPE